MSGEIEINHLIIESLNNNCTDKPTKNLIESLIKYERDIFNRRIPEKEVKDHYMAYIDKAVREMKD